jgi:hypothetical protein
MVGEDYWPVALGNAPHGHMEHAMLSLNIMLLQPIREENRQVKALVDRSEQYGGSEGPTDTCRGQTDICPIPNGLLGP